MTQQAKIEVHLKTGAAEVDGLQASVSIEWSKREPKSQRKTILLQQRILDRLYESTTVTGQTNEDWAKELGVSVSQVRTALFKLQNRSLVTSRTRRFLLYGRWIASRQILAVGHGP